MSGLAGAGGATFFLAADSEVKTIDFIPPVPSGFDIDQVDKVKTESGSNASVTPGNLAGWHALQSRYGCMSFDEVLRPAIRLAQDGFPVSSFFVAMTQGSIGRIKDPEWRRVFRAEQDWQTGQVLQLSDLATTLEQIATEGINCLYGGALGEKLVSRIQSDGGSIAMADLEAVSPIWELSLIHISEPTRLGMISYADFC